MWISRRIPTQMPLMAPQRSKVDRDFQIRLTARLFALICIPILFVLGPAYFLFLQNYHIFIHLAYGVAPQIVNNLSQEQMWLHVLFFTAGIGIAAFCLIVGHQMAKRFSVPIRDMERHLRLLTRGYWSIPDLSETDAQEFRELVATYNYFYRTLQALNQHHLNMLRDLRTDPADPNSQSILTALIAAKLQPLEEINGFASNARRSLDRRRAS